MKRIVCIAAVTASGAVSARVLRPLPTHHAGNECVDTPTGMLQSVTMKDSSVHYDLAVLKPGSSHSHIEAAFGEPNAIHTTTSGQTEDVYAFNPNGTKFVKPQVRPRNLALAFFTRGMSVAVPQARLSITEKN